MRQAPGSSVLAETGGDAMPAKRGKPQRRTVDVNKQSELRAWAKYWGCAQRDVRDAVKVNGVMAVDVQDWLRINTVR
jgi:Protein of unknown function (DUF3606)